MDFIPNTDADRAEMLRAIGVDSFDELLAAVPEGIRRPELRLPPPLSEMELASEMRSLAEQNVDALHNACFLGAGSYNHYVPAAVSQLLLRSEFYTSYTPYQPEVSQGILQATFEFQSMICALTGMDVTNASMYDGATAVAEAALMAMAATGRCKVVVSGSVHPEYRAVLGTYMQSRGCPVFTTPVSRKGDRIVEEDIAALVDEETACVIVQQPDFFGRVRDLTAIVERVHAAGGLVIVSSDPISLGMLRSPGAWGADIAVGEGQGLGSPMGFGGPYLGLLACREKLIRQMPGRLVGQAFDAKGRRGFVLTLQAREQHIRREKASSNICTSEALVAVGAAIYMALMGPRGLAQVAQLCYEKAHYARSRIAKLPGFRVLDTGPFFNEFVVETSVPPMELNRLLLESGIIGGHDLSSDYPGLDGCALLCVTETNSRPQIDALAEAMGDIAAAKGGAR
ncbi:MAG TPA: aminomethyl-transferring glycine dehydrogenase subunit GcvPA [Chloroflexota bacterium]